MSLLTNFALPSFFLAGIFNILLIKYCDTLESKGIDGKYRRFQHPLIQTIIMFYGEIICFVIFKIAFLILQRRRNGAEDINLLTSGGREFSLKIFLIPALCDFLASFLFLAGLSVTYAVSSQILRGTAIIFAGFLSVTFLSQSLKSHHWFGMLTISLATILVCVADIDNSRAQYADYRTFLTGDLLIIASQVFQAIQLVYEEKYIKVLNIPELQAIGWEGIFGFLISIILLIPFNFLKITEPFGNNSKGVIEDLPDAMYQLFNNYQLIFVHGLFLLSVIIYNYAGLCITKHTASVNRVIINCLGIIFIWLAALLFEMEMFSILQVLGLVLLLSGVFIYKNIVFVQCYRWTMGRLTRRRYGELDSEQQQVTSQPADAI